MPPVFPHHFLNNPYRVRPTSCSKRPFFNGLPYRDRPKPTRSWIRKNSARLGFPLNSCESSYRTQRLKLARAQYSCNTSALGGWFTVVGCQLFVGLGLAVRQPAKKGVTPLACPAAPPRVADLSLLRAARPSRATARRENHPSSVQPGRYLRLKRASPSAELVTRPAAPSYSIFWPTRYDTWARSICSISVPL